MKRVLLINTNTETRPYPVPPMGLCLVANSLTDHYEVKLFDGTFSSEEQLNDLLDAFKPDYIGFSIRNIDDMSYDALHYYADDIYQQFIQAVKKRSDAVIILGGAGFSMFPEVLMKTFGADYGVVGAGEFVFPLLLDQLEKGSNAFGIPGVISADGSLVPASAKENSQGLYGQNPSMIDRWLDFGPYRERGAYSIQTKRGCSFQCIYCTYPLIEGCCYLLRPVSEIVDEMQDAYNRLGDITFEFVDSIFNDPPGHAEAICREIIGRHLKFRMRTMGINPGATSHELFNLMLRAGFLQIDCTPDSASPEMLRKLRKNFNLQSLTDTARIIREMKIPSMWFFIFGGPGESIQSVGESFDFIDQHISEEDMVHISCGLRIYPGTKLEKIAIEEKVIRADDSLLQPAFYFSPELPHDELLELLLRKTSTRANCILSHQSTPDDQMIREALKIRRELALDEPMFRTLLRLRRMDR